MSPYCTLLVLYFLQFSNSARILVVLPSPILSHNVVYRTIYKELALKGHDLVVFTPDPLRENSLSNVKEIDTSYLYKKVENAPAEFFTRVGSACQDVFLDISREVLTHPEMTRMVEDPETRFDLFLVEWGVNPSLGVLGRRFDCPTIGMRSTGLSIDGHDYVGNPTNPAYIPNGLTDFDGSFWSRTGNLMFGIVWRLTYHFYTVPRAQRLIDELFPKYSGDVLEMQKNASLLLTNTHPVFTGVRPIVPANVEVGGIHLRKEVQALPKEILTFLDSADDGAVYVNLGSSSTNIPNLTPTVLKTIISALSQLPYRVIFRWDETDPSMATLPGVMISKWLPQQAILAHRNVKVFLTNAGLQSFYEAVDNKVPVIALPLFADQHINARRVEKLKIGKRLDIAQIDTKSLLNTISIVAESLIYKKNMRKAREILHDLPMKPLEKAVWWIEFVLRHKGARHLRCPAIDLDWIKYLLLDVFAFVGFCLLAALVLAYYLVVWLRNAILMLRRKYSKRKTE